ncbi:MAG: hypothetical protein F6J93_37800 [Oscillatoria sp. SIO1A7]|nr:hypothetical protein [Oscillatoria sp. SIO1A7]
MKAIVLTYDRYVKVLDHTLHTYQNLWPSNPFTFRVPYQVYPHFLKEKYGDKIELVASPKQIKPTVEKLLEDLPDSEWVYWCIDDKYLLEIKEKKVTDIYHWVKNIQDPKIGSVMFSRSRNLLKRQNLNYNKTIRGPENTVFIQRWNYAQIWLHQFVRVKVLKTLFAGFPDRDFAAKEMDRLKREQKVPRNQELYVAKKNMVIFGESTSRGQLTKNCVESFQKWGLEVPSNLERSDREIIIGKLPPKIFGIEVPFLN